jgi:uncharacterized protein
MRPMRRREFLQASAAGFAAAATTGALRGAPAHADTAGAAAESLPPYVGAGSTAPVRPFQLYDVRLGDGLFQEKRDRMKNFVRQFDERRFLVLFNNNSGRPNPPGVPVVGGWEDGGQLSGHWTGYYLTALAQCYADQGEPVFKEKLDWMVNELAAVQDAIAAKVGGGGEPPAPVEIGRVPGKYGTALRLGGTSNAQYVQLPPQVVTELRDFTFAAWVDRATTEGQNWARIFDFGSGTTANMFLTVSAGGGGARFAITVTGAGGEQRITAPAQLPTGWTHVAVSLAGSTGTLYVGGQAVAQNTAMTLNPSNLTGANNLWIGRSQYSDPYLDATVDEFHIFDRALSQAEIQSLMDSSAGTTGGGNVAWYGFDEDGGTEAVDSSSHHRSATIVPVPNPADWVPTYPGYLGALPDDLVLRLGPPRFATYGGDSGTWAPWYTQHKLMRGLLDAYYLAGNEQALAIVTKMADWAHLVLTLGDKNNPDYTGPITRGDLNFMWDTYIAGEFGAANEPIAELYALTGDEQHLETAKFFDNRQSLFGACVDNRDILVLTSETNPGPRRPNRLHANQHVPNNLGYLRILERTGENAYHRAAKNFFGMVIPHRMYGIGGTGGNYPGSNSNIEQFQNRDNIANAIAQSGSETETTHNLIKLARNLFFHAPDAAYMDYYERGLVNQILGSRGDEDSAGDPLITYFQPLSPGATRDYGNLGTGDGGAGLEDQTKYQEAIYARSADGSSLWVNLYIASTLNWAEKGFAISQQTAYPREDKSRLIIDGSGRLDVKLRVPAWVQKAFTVAINGVRQRVNAKPGTYLTLSRTWRRGDKIDISMPFSVRIERAIDRPDTQSVFWGPVLMAILGNPGGGSYRELTLYRFLKRDGDYSRAAITPAAVTPAGDQTFTTHGFTLRPWYIGDSQRHSAYFRRVEPEVVFGSITTGVPNRKRDDDLPNYDVPVQGITSPGDDGLTFLDIVWDQAPFAYHSTFVSTVARTADHFVARGLFTEEEKDIVVSAAAHAGEELAR